MTPLPTVRAAGDAIAKHPGYEAQGEYVVYEGREFFAPAGRCIGRDRVVSLRWEGHYCGRVHGEREFILVAFNGTDFTVLEWAQSGHVREALAKYRGMTCAEAITHAQALQDAEDRKRAEFQARLPRCKVCSQPFIVFEDDLPDGICSRECLEKQE